MRSTEVLGALSLMRGGLVHSLLDRLGLLGRDALPNARTCAAVIGFAWLPMAALAALDARNWTLHFGSNFFVDLGVYSRLFVGILVLLISERLTDLRINRMLASFEESGILGPESHHAFLKLLVRADRRTGSIRNESLMLLAAVLLASLSTAHSLFINPGSWLAAGDGMPGPLSPAGWWQLLVALPVFMLLVFRWLWRLVAWGVLLRGIARLPLRLVPTHPDRSGGLAFLTLFPMMFAPLVFSLGAVIASQALQEILYAGADIDKITGVAVTWVMLVLLVFVGPLTAFLSPLARLKERAIVEYGEMLTRFNRQVEAQFAADDEASRPLDPVMISAAADIAAALDTIYGMRVIPVRLWSLGPLVAAAILPMLAVLAAQVPFPELLRMIASVLR